ncbi:type IV toxin-antitoxin system AbiEi family antitoxin domain-containing protein [Phycisphaera mikurensis]|uniref:AbiEi antitoxin C-terminal domain-containing protein n=1 Tax=Phycisphaera mikurensis (strain NBRC 102666 / KCTC 22515 / FYK2301M01) TaxID=1142394 RepID=I0IJH9_PHYMF|nr:hypothetical protein [Phycisphaera mikurensis]MBB6443167.1 hypothetical protein [Phycisphaera mikurensis]BAM05417.1 hypothetical protein PSMK_p00550 [Phycisphaera mikurensis NBRC 102666]
MATRLQLARPRIKGFFDESGTKVFRLKELSQVFDEQREGWKLAHRTSRSEFVKDLCQHGELRILKFAFPFRPETRYVWGDVPLLAVLATLKTRGYFCHYTALVLHGLTEQNPKTIYLNDEQTPKPPPSGEMEQLAIDRAFAGKQRTTTNRVEHGGNTIVILNGMNTGNAGVETRSFDLEGRAVELPVAGAERALIDATVRADYCGGVGEVLKAYELAGALEPGVSINRLAALLKKIGYRYPYHQSIGFYLERSGAFKPELIERFRSKFDFEFDFYLGYRMGKTEYVPRWKLHVPAGF